MSYSIAVKVKSPTFSNRRLNVGVRIGGTPGPAGPAFDYMFDAGSINISGASAIDITDATSIPSNALTGVITLTSSNATESIDQLANMVEGVPVRFFAEAGLKVTFESNNLDVGSVGDPLQPRCLGGVNITINGDYHEWIEFTKIDGDIVQTNSGIYTL